VPGLVVVSGPSGVGKSTIVRALADRDPRVAVSVSATTRDQRPGEVEGDHYRFLSEEDFDRLVSEQAFLEHAIVHGHRYGTLRSDVDALTSKGKVVVLEIDVQGARSVRDVAPNATLVFILPPDHEALSERLKGRATEDPETRDLRLRNALAELPEASWFDHRLVNDDLEATIGELGRIIGGILDGSSRNPPVKEYP
jgi:guanylate kinase